MAGKIFEGALKAMSSVNTALFRATRGKVGGKFGKVSILLLTTTGRRSGQPRTKPLLYLPDGDRYVLVASKGGSDTHPLWYLNLKAQPQCEVEVDDTRRPMHARTATDEERDALWPRLTRVWPQYDDYQRKTSRRIPVVILEPQ